MNNDIINLLNIEDKDVIITNTSIEGNIKKIYIERTGINLDFTA